MLLAREKEAGCRYRHQSPGSPGSPLAEGNDLNREIYTRLALLAW
jgi:hypothetical protein